MSTTTHYYQILFAGISLFACTLSFSMDDDQIDNLENFQNTSYCPQTTSSLGEAFTIPIKVAYAPKRDEVRKRILRLFLTDQTTQAMAELQNAEGIVQYMVGVDLIPSRRLEAKLCFELITKGDESHFPKQVITSAYHNLSCLLDDEGKTTEALQHALKAAMSLDPEALLNVGNLLCKNGKLSDALGYFMVSSHLGNAVATESLKHVIRYLHQRPLSPLEILQIKLVQKAEQRELYYQAAKQN